MAVRIFAAAALIALVSFASAQAQMNRQASIHLEVANALQRLVERAPLESWDDLRVSAPRAVRWHLVPPDRADAENFRRSGWIEADGRQAGVAACGDRDGPAVVSFRADGATWTQNGQDPVLSALAQTVSVSRDYYEPTMVGEVERFEVQTEGGEPATLWRMENCSREGGRARQRCDTTYQLVIRDGRRDCPAP